MDRSRAVRVRVQKKKNSHKTEQCYGEKYLMFYVEVQKKDSFSLFCEYLKQFPFISRSLVSRILPNVNYNWLRAPSLAPAGTPVIGGPKSTVSIFGEHATRGSRGRVSRVNQRIMRSGFCQNQKILRTRG